jgi:hypothetical protein
MWQKKLFFSGGSGQGLVDIEKDLFACSHKLPQKKSQTVKEQYHQRWGLCGPAVYFVLTNGDLRQRE